MPQQSQRISPRVSSPRISLAQLKSAATAQSNHQSRIQSRTDADIDEGATPTLRDLTETLLFSPGDGRIWLNDQRMILWRSSTYGSLRRELIASVGHEQARSLLTRAGYAAGAKDAELVRRMWPDSDQANAFHAGPRMHKLQGIVRPETVAFEFDIARGDFHADFYWHDSSEDDEHIAAFGIGTEPACWMQVGYASGYASAFMGKLIMYREVACRSSGAEVCRIIGKPADQWISESDEATLDLRYLTPDVSAVQLRQAVQKKLVQVPSTSSAHVSRLWDASSHDGGALSGELIGVSSSFSAARHLIERVAPTQATILFTGPSGAGKELFAQTVHRISPRADKPFIALNCAAIPDTLIESELFGVERGAFTGATVSRPGRFERAHGGTLFLDEIASLSFEAQGKLLRALQERKIERVGGLKEIPVDVRVIAATNVDLRDVVKAGRFREDLFFRLNVFPIALPPLKERRDDIPLLMEAFLRRYSNQHQRDVPGFTHRAVQTLLQYDFPGNIRELQNLVERGVIMAGTEEPIDVHHMFRGGEMTQETSLRPPLGLGASGHLVEVPVSAALGSPLTASAISHESRFTQSKVDQGRPSFSDMPNISADKKQVSTYRNALISNRYNVAETARQLGLTRAQFAYRLRKLGIV